MSQTIDKILTSDIIKEPHSPNEIRRKAKIERIKKKWNL